MCCHAQDTKLDIPVLVFIINSSTNILSWPSSVQLPHRLQTLYRSPLKSCRYGRQPCEIIHARPTIATSVGLLMPLLNFTSLILPSETQSTANLGWDTTAAPIRIEGLFHLALLAPNYKLTPNQVCYKTQNLGYNSISVNITI